MPDGILIVNKPAGWTASESGLVEHSAAARLFFLATGSSFRKPAALGLPRRTGDWNA